MKSTQPGRLPLISAAAAALLTAGCLVGPDYERPTTATPPAYKATEMGTWKEGEPRDAVPKGSWWEVFGDPELNALEEKAMSANQELQAAFAVVNQSRAAARVARADFFPTIDANPSYRRERFSVNQEPDFGATTADTIRVPLDLSYEVDLWGRVRRGFEGAKADAEAGAALYNSVSLTLQADVAQNYFGLRALDSEIAVLKRAIVIRQEQLEIVQARLDSGLGNELDVVRARTELATTEAELATLTRRRIEFENALAILTGENPTTFHISAIESLDERWAGELPVIPAGLPSELLERRPDVAEAERRLAAENARIGVAKAAFFPVLRLTGSGGFVSAEVESLFNWESRIWTFGPSLSLPIFAGGRNRANLERSRARYEEVVARYRQQVLVAFGEVENALAGIHLLGEQAAAQERALASAREARSLALQSFTVGITDYLDVIDADRVALQNQRSSLQLEGQRFIAAVQLVKALGGGWDAATREMTSR